MPNDMMQGGAGGGMGMGGGMGAQAPSAAPAQASPQVDIVGELYTAIEAVAAQIGAPAEELIMALAKRSVDMTGGGGMAQAAPRRVPSMFQGEQSPYAGMRG